MLYYTFLDTYFVHVQSDSFSPTLSLELLERFPCCNYCCNCAGSFDFSAPNLTQLV